jgi:chorismate mutase
VSVTKTSIDALVERSGFADSLVNVGWLRVRDGSLEVPNFDRHLSQSAKQRALTAARVNRHKQQKGNAPSVSDALPREEKRRDSISKKYLEIQERAPPKFLKPTIEEVTAYCHERNNSVDPLTWLAHYEANGWKVGRNPMKDWRAAVRTWEARSGDYKPKPGNGKKSIEDTLKELQNMNLGGDP